MLFLGQISSDLQMAEGGALDSEGSAISGIDEYIPDHLTAKRMNLDTSSRWCCCRRASGWLSNLFGESDEA